MIPLIVAALAKAGLGLLGNAVLAKGKEVVEQKLGINLDEMLGTPEGRIALKKIEAEREAELHEFVLAQRDQELKADALAYADTASARDMNNRVNESANAAWLSKNIAGILALTVVLGGGAMLAWSPNADVRTAVVGLMTVVLGFYFGSSVGNKRKDEAIARIAEGGQS